MAKKVVFKGCRDCPPEIGLRYNCYYRDLDAKPFPENCPLEDDVEVKELSMKKLAERFGELEENQRKLAQKIEYLEYREQDSRTIPEKEQPDYEKYYFDIEYTGIDSKCAEKCNLSRDGVMVGSIRCREICVHFKGKGEDEKGHWIKCSKIKEATEKSKISYKREIITYNQDDIPDDMRTVIGPNMRKMYYSNASVKGWYIEEKKKDSWVILPKDAKFTWQENHLGKEEK